MPATNDHSSDASSARTFAAVDARRTITYDDERQLHHIQQPPVGATISTLDRNGEETKRGTIGAGAPNF